MKKIFWFFLLICSINLSAQNYPITSINISLPANPDANTARWGSSTSTLTITANARTVNGKIDDRVRDGRILVTIRKESSKVCGTNTSNTAPSANFNTSTKVWSGANAVSLLAQECLLPSGDYELCVQFFADGAIGSTPISEEKRKQFTIKGHEQINYQSPQNISPIDAASIAASDIKKPISFRWTPVVPKPQESTTYRLKVWQLMQGQNGTQAMKANQPIITKDVDNLTQAIVTNLYTGPCKPPYLCDFIWNVQAVNREGKPIGRNNGTSEPYSFKILEDNINTKIDSVKVGCCIKGKQTIYVKVSNLHPANQAQVTAIKYRVNGTWPLTTLSPTTPAIPFTINANSSQAFTVTINCVDSMKTIKFIVETIWPTDPDNINNETAWDTLKCACTACDEKNFTLNAPAPGNISISNNTISFNQPITVTTTPAKTIKTIKAELVYYEMVPENDMCIPCNKDAATYGHFTNGTNSQEWNGPQQTLNINITTPQLTPCCSAVFKWCIRYKIEFTDCTTCNKVVCYEKKKEGCEKINNNNLK